MSVTGLFALTSGNSLFRNVAIPNLTSGGTWPNLTDIYVPLGYQTSMTCLHGGGGTKLQMAIDMHVVVSPGNQTYLVNWQLLTTWKCIVVCPQGQACTGVANANNPNGVNTISAQNPNGITAWSSHDMWSQNDDVAFLTDLSSFLTTNFGLGAQAKTLMGHSEGGIMASRMWREQPNVFHTHAHVCGPSSSYYVANPVVPSTVRPIIGFQGFLDSTLACYNAYINNVVTPTPGSIFTAALYWQDPGNINRANTAFPGQGSRIGSWQDFQNQLSYNGDSPVVIGSGVTTPITVGNKVVWQNPAKNIQLWEISASDHKLPNIQKCLGNGLFSQIALFAATT